MDDSNPAKSHTSLKTQESRSFSPVTKQTNSQFADLLAKAIPNPNSTDPQKALELENYPDLQRIVLFGKKELAGFQMSATSLIKEITSMTRTYFQLPRILI